MIGVYSWLVNFISHHKKNKHKPVSELSKFISQENA